MKLKLGQEGKTNWGLVLAIGAGLFIFYFLFLRPPDYVTPISISGAIEVHNMRQGETIEVGIYQYSGSEDDPLGDLINERDVLQPYTIGTETFDYNTGCYEQQIEGNYFVVFVQACPGGWKVLDVRDGPVFTNVDLMRRWGEGGGF